MEFIKVIRALGSKTRLEIIKILGKKANTTTGVFREISRSHTTSVQYRESVYRELEKLVEVGLVEKFYQKGVGISYRLIHQKITLDLMRGNIIEA